MPLGAVIDDALGHHPGGEIGKTLTLAAVARLPCGIEALLSGLVRAAAAQAGCGGREHGIDLMPHGRRAKESGKVIEAGVVLSPADAMEGWMATWTLKPACGGLSLCNAGIALRLPVVVSGNDEHGLPRRQPVTTR